MVSSHRNNWVTLLSLGHSLNFNMIVDVRIKLFFSVHMFVSDFNVKITEDWYDKVCTRCKAM